VWERFQRHVVYWQVLLGLQHWGVTCRLAAEDLTKVASAELQDDNESCTIAWVAADNNNQLATVYLVEDWTEYGGVNQAEVDKAAFHEVCHLFLAPLEFLAADGASQSRIGKEVHKLIRVLENTFYENQKKELVNGR
jgi:hypothetical protein